MAQANFGTMELIGMVSKKWRTRGLTVHQRLKITGFLFLVPALILWLAFHFYPIINTFRLSLYRYDLLTPKRYLGLNNYINLVTDRTFLESCRVTLIYVFGTYVPVFVLSLAVALALRSIDRLQGLFRAVFFMPNIVSIVSICVIWKLIFHPSGLSANITQLFHPEPFAWLHYPTSSQIALIITNVWREFGYFTVLFLAGLLGIPQEYYEAAYVDGANSLRVLFNITLPLMKRTIVFVIVLSVVRGMQTFVPQFVMTRGGPGMANTPITLHIYNNVFVYYKMGLASAMAVLLAIVVLFFTFLQMRLFEKEGA